MPRLKRLKVCGDMWRGNDFGRRHRLQVADDPLDARPVAIGIYDVTGRLVRELLEAPVHPGHHALNWDGRGSNREVLAAGVYFLRVAIGDDVMTEKLSLVK